MTRISSLFLASTLAILPISAFAQQTATTTKSTAPTSMATTTDTTKPAVNAPMQVKPGVAAATSETQPAKPVAKAPANDTKTQVHGMNIAKPHHAKTNTPTKAS